MVRGPHHMEYGHAVLGMRGPARPMYACPQCRLHMDRDVPMAHYYNPRDGFPKEIYWCKCGYTTFRTPDGTLSIDPKPRVVRMTNT